MEDKYCVYMHTLKSDGRKYIGITNQSPKCRWHRGRGYLNCTHMWNAIQKYGWDSFKHEVLFENLTKEQACAKEQALIKLFASNNPKFGFNITNGGDHCIHSEETKEKISAKVTKYEISREQLYNLYISQNLSAQQIADLCNIPYGTIVYKLAKYKLKKLEFEVADYEAVKYYYSEVGWTIPNIASYLNCSKNSVKCIVQQNQLVRKKNKIHISKADLEYLYWAADKTMQEIAELYSCSRSLIKKYIKMYGLQKTLHISEADLIQKYVAGHWSVKQIASHYGCSTNNIYRLFKKYNIRRI